MLNFSAVALRRGPRVLLEQLSFTIYAGQRVGVVGRNGTGKTSLFALLLGELSADVGDLTVPDKLEIATVRQETPGLPQPALEFVLDGDAELRRVEAQLARAQDSGDGGAIARWHEAFEHIDGYSARARASRLLGGLGFDDAATGRPVAEFSGGWRVRLNLAQALMCRADLLLLDEPTNHLDLDALIWLQQWLQNWQGTLLVISHDRDFLDGVTTHTLHLERQRAILYSGNYSTCERVRAQHMLQRAAEFSAQARRTAELQRFIDRFRAKATKARQAQSRIKQLGRMQAVEPAHWDAPFDFEFAKPQRLPAPLLRWDDAALGYTDAPILSGMNLALEPGDRVGLLGRNGAGKTTLVKGLNGDLTPSGKQLRDPWLNPGYFAQHQVDALDAGASALAHLRKLDEDLSEQKLRDYLGGFDFRGDRVFEPVDSFSGGEKARLALALMAWPRPNLLLLDEPTNHLDIEMRHALEQALHAYEGAVVLVSHDRHLLTTCCDVFWLVDAGRVRVFDGDLDDYSRWLSESAVRASGDSSPGDARPAARERRRAAADQRELEKPLRRAVKAAERALEKAQEERGRLQAKLADPALYESAGADVPALVREQGELGKRIEQLENTWLNAMDELEQAIASSADQET